MTVCTGNVEPCILNIHKVYEYLHGKCGGLDYTEHDMSKEGV